MSERKFDYNSVGAVYNNMKNINDNIKTLLMDTDNEVYNKVDVCEEAIYGDLGNQLLLSWDNISSNFPNFVDNFENWSALVAKASGDYSQFEADVAAFKNANPLGVTSAGATQGAVVTSSYNNSLSADQIQQLDVATVFYEPTGATYIDTGMVDYAKKHKTMNIVGDVLSVASIVLSVVQVGSAIKAAQAVATPAVAIAGGADDAVLALTSGADDAALALTSGSDDAALALTSGADDVVVNSTDDLISQGYTMGSNGAMHPPASSAGAPTAANSAFASSTDDLISQGYTMGSNGAMHAPASMSGAPTAGNSAFANSVDDVIVNSTDDLIGQGYTMGSNGAMHAPASASGAPTVGNSAFANSVDDVVSSGTKNFDDLISQTSSMTSKEKAQFVQGLVDDGTITNKSELLQFFGGKESVAKTTFGSLNNGHGGSGVYRKIVKGFNGTPTTGGVAITNSVDDVIVNSTDDLIGQGYTMGSNGAMHAPASMSGAPTAGNSAFASSTDDLIGRGYTMGSNGAMHAPASVNGAPTAGNSVFASSTDDLIGQGYTMGSNGAMHAPASMSGAPTAGNSAFASSTDDLIGQGYTMGSNGAMHAPASASGAPTAGNSAFYNSGYAEAHTVSTVYGPPTGGNSFSIRNGIQTIKKLNAVGSGPGNHAGLATGVNIANMAYDEYADDNRRVN